MRWKYTIPALVILLLVVLFNWFCLDWLLKLAVVATGEFAFGAKVEVASLHTQVLRLSVDLRGLQVADQDAPLRNLFSVDRIAFALEPLPLLSKKLIIHEMSLEGLRWGTARKTSGALPSKKKAEIEERKAANPKQSFFAKFSGQMKAQGLAQTKALPALSTLKDAQSAWKTTSPDQLVKAQDLKSLQAGNTLKTEYQQKAVDYEKQLDALKLNEHTTSLRAAIDAVSKLKVSNAQEALAAREPLERLRQELGSAQAAQQQMQQLKTRFDADFSGSQGALQAFERLKQQDLDALSAKLKLPSLGGANLTEALIGPLWLSRLQTTLNLLETARHYMPSRPPKAAVVAQPRLRGMDVHFPLNEPLPSFLIRQIQLSGSTGGDGKRGESLDFKGTVTDVTSDPATLGRPTRAELNGDQAGRRLNLKATLDHTQEVPSDQINASLSGLSAADLSTGGSEYLPNLEHSSMDLATQVLLRGEALTANLNLTLTHLSGQGAAAALWQGVPAIRIKAEGSGTPDRFDLKVSSDLDRVLQARLGQLVGAQAAGLQQKLKQTIDQLTADQEQALSQQVGQLGQGLGGKLGLQQKDLQAQLDQAKTQLEQKSGGAQDLLKAPAGKVEDQLRNLFKH